MAYYFSNPLAQVPMFRYAEHVKAISSKEVSRGYTVKTQSALRYQIKGSETVE